MTITSQSSICKVGCRKTAEEFRKESEAADKVLIEELSKILGTRERFITECFEIIERFKKWKDRKNETYTHLRSLDKEKADIWIKIWDSKDVSRGQLHLPFILDQLSRIVAAFDKPTYEALVTEFKRHPALKSDNSQLADLKRTLDSRKP